MAKARKHFIEKDQSFGRLSVMREVAPRVYGKQKIRRIECVCECGTIKEYFLADLVNGKVLSCGCLNKDINTKHGLSSHFLYKTYNGMKDRCFNTGCKDYAQYGGRGITMHDNWIGKDGLQNFIKWHDNLPKNKQWKFGLQIDRRRNMGNYEPNNCHFVTPLVNNNNRRNCVYVRYQGTRYTLKQVCQKIGVVAVGTVYDRLKAGWPLDKAVKTPSLIKRA